MIFADTGALFALVVTDDRHHSAIAAWRKSNNQSLITTDYCVDELPTLLVARKRTTLAVTTGWRIFNEELCDLHFLTPDQFAALGSFFNQNTRSAGALPIARVRS
jgi:predicted nucleic acid-binding protein